MVPEVRVTGPEETVFDWSEDACEPENIPDIAARAFRDSDDQVQLTIGHYVNYRMIGLGLDEVVTDCIGPLLVSDFDPDHTQFNDPEWIGSPYTLDGETVYAIVHNEYRGDTHEQSRPDQCPSKDRYTCLDTSLTMQISIDGGDTFTDILPPPDHLVATLPYTYDDDGVPSGLRQPSNIIQGPDDYYYLFANISDYPTEEQWVCAMRTDDLDDPGSWRFWNGNGFDGRFVNPYVDDPSGAAKCAPLAFEDLAGGIQESVVWVEPLQRYAMVGIDAGAHHGPEPRWGVYYSFSEDLITWTTRRLLIELPITASVGDPLSDVFYAYPAIMDPDSTSRNFESSDGSAYLYITVLNEGANSLDRDLVRYPIQFDVVELTTPEWAFDVDGDAGPWYALNNVGGFDVVDGELIMRTTGDDPSFASTLIDVPATSETVAIRMSVSGTGDTTWGELFFTTRARRNYGERTLQVFEVIADGEYHDYVFDWSESEEWNGIITTFRIDPAPDAGRDIAVDRIWFPES